MIVFPFISTLGSSAASESKPGKYIRTQLLILSIATFSAGLLLFSLTAVYPSLKIQLFVSGFALSFVGMLLIRHFWPRNWGLLPLMTLAFLARVVLLPLAPSDDLNRYLWEGKIQLHQMSPYEIAPENPQTENLRDSIWQGINHKEYTTIYGPLAQILFKLSAAVWCSPLSMKLLLLTFDICTLLILVSYLRKRESLINDLLLYAINPLVLYSFAAEVHLESVMLCMLAMAMLLYQRRRFGWMFFFMGCAVAVKLTALMFIPLFVRKDTVKYFPFTLLPAVFALPYLSGIASLLTVTLKFGAEFRFNGCSYGLLSSFLSDHFAILLSSGIFMFAYVWNFFLTPDPVKASGNVAIAFLLTSPTAHPWYFTVIAMFAVLYPARSWIVLSGTVGISWLVSFTYWFAGIWKEHFSFLLFEYVLPLLAELTTRWRWTASEPDKAANSLSTSIVIPVLNEAEQLKECLETIQLPHTVRYEILVVDGGSEDATLTVAHTDDRVRIVSSEKGRGIQISRGIEESTGDVIIILHADSRLETGSVCKILHYCEKHPNIIGGSVASRFDNARFRSGLITILNNFRSRCSGISFGDQVQFFRRKALADNLPRVMLMEDIELSMRLKELGSVTILPSIATSSSRRWKNRSYILNIFTVISLTALYLIKRRFGLLSRDNSEFYEAYYGKT